MNKILLTINLLLLPLLALAQKPSLVEFFNSETSTSKNVSRASSDVTIIDLSEWENDYDETLNIGTGRSYRFINGELRWVGASGKPLINISKKSKIEIEETATFIDTNGSNLIEMNGGYLYLNGGILCSDNNQNISSRKTIVVTWPIGKAISMLDGDNIFQMNDGTVYGYIDNTSTPNAHNSICLGKGVVKNSITTYHDITISENTQSSSPWIVSLHGDAVVSIQNLANGLNHSTSFVVNSEMVAGKVLVKGENGYQIKESDLGMMSIYDESYREKYHLSLENNQVVLRENNTWTEKTLQQKIDNSPAHELTTITIPDEGIVLTEPLWICEHANIELTGGKLSISPEYSDSYDCVVKVVPDGRLTLKNIIWDSNFYTSAQYTFHVAGELTIDEGVVFKNTYVEKPVENSTFIMNHGIFNLNGSDIEFNGTTVNQDNTWNTTGGVVNIFAGSLHSNFKNGYAILNGTVNLHGGGIVGNIKANNYLQKGGLTETNSIEVDYFELQNGAIGFTVDGRLRVNDELVLKGGKLHSCSLEVQKLILDGYSYTNELHVKFIDYSKPYGISVYQKLVTNVNVYGSWDEMDYPAPIVRGTAMQVRTEGGKKIIVHEAYDLTSDDLSHFNFVNLPSGKKAVLDNAIDGVFYLGNVIYIKKKSLADLFNSVEDNGTEEKPVLMTPEGIDDTDVEEPSEGKPNLHALFGDPEDKEEGTEPTKSLHLLFDGEYGLNVPETSTYEFKNININLGGHSIEHVIYVNGTLIININVYFTNITSYIKHIIYIRRGGKLIWRGGTHHHPGIIVINEGGTIIYEGGDSYGNECGINNTGGTVNVTGGSIGSNSHGIHNNEGGTVNVTSGYIYGGNTSGNTGGNTGGGTGGNTGGNSNGSYTSESGHAIWNGPNSWINLYGGEYDEGSSVWNEGYLTLDGSVNISEYYIRHNITIKIISQIIVNWHFFFIDIAEFNLNIPLFIGEDYTLTEDDLKHIHIDLPSGYYLVLDINLNAIYIRKDKPTDIGVLDIDDKCDTRTYSPMGVYRTTIDKGINIAKGKKFIMK